MRLNYVGMVMILAMLLISSIVQAASLNQVPIVDEASIATPTATWLPSLIPTPTFTPEANTVNHESMRATDAVPGGAGGYTVQEGDSVETVAIEMGLDLADLPCAVHPTFRLTDPLVIGDVVFAPEPGMACHQVEQGETLAAVAALYKVTGEDIRSIAWNRLDEATTVVDRLSAGTYIRIPPMGGDATTSAGFLAFMLDQPINTSPFVGYAVGGTGSQTTQAKSVPSEWPFGSGQFAWPAYGWLSQGYRYDHRAIDVAAPTGTFVTAADRGVVMRAGWNDQGYGLFVVIDHNIDYVTLYAHLHDVLVDEGDVVAKGQLIGTVGSTGNSTGPHLHFEIRDFGRRANPLELINR